MANFVNVNTGVARALTNGLVVEMIISQAAIETYEIMKENISKTYGSGKVYKRKGVVHVSSGPGQFPTKDSGFLIGSVGITNPEGIDFGTKNPDVLQLTPTLYSGLISHQEFNFAKSEVDSLFQALIAGCFPMSLDSSCF
jgi:hypothetical protein